MDLLTQQTWVVFSLVTVLTAVLCMLLIPLAKKFQLVDHPGARKVHEASTALTGGIAIYLSVVIGAYFLSNLFTGNADVRILMIGACLMLIVGILDDRWEISPTIRFLAQILACMFVCRYTDWIIEDFGSLFSSSVVGTGVMAIPITIFAALGVVNAFNLVDGMDGLAGSLFMVAAVPMIAFASLAGHQDIAAILLLSSAAVLGFLLLNARFAWNSKARMFLGDAGSLVLGFLLAWSLIRLGSGHERAYMPITAVWIYAVPLLDTATLIWRRWREGRSAIHADQNHLHHIFLRAGFSVEETWVMIFSFAVLLAGVGIVFEIFKLPEWLGFYTFMLVAFGYYFYLKHCWAAQKFLGRHFIHHDFDVDEPMARIGRS